MVLRRQGRRLPEFQTGSYSVTLLAANASGSGFGVFNIVVGARPAFATQPRSQNFTVGGTVVFTASATSSSGLVSYQWQKNGVALERGTSSSYFLIGAQQADAGAYTVTITNAVGSVTSEPAVLGLVSTAKVLGAGTEVGANIVHPNGNVYDQILLTGPTATITADPKQVTRISFIDLNDDIVQVEFGGAGTLTLNLANATGPEAPVKYNQAVTYMKGHASIIITGADETTNVSVFSVGRANAVNQALFKDNVSYDGFADIALVAIASTNGKFGGARMANVSFFATSGQTGLSAPGVEFTGPVFVGNISANDNATPMLVLGKGDDVRITGGDLMQPNSAPVAVSGIVQLKFAAGTTSHGTLLPAKANRARLVQNGTDVTNTIVVNPTQ